MFSELNKTTESTQAVNKLFGLEAIRFISALAVLFWHYQHFSYLADQRVDFVRENQPFYAIFSIFYLYGYYGVHIFWCISGFIFFWKYKNAIADKRVSGKSFFIFRFSRLYPLHFVTLLLIALLQYFYFSQKGFYFVYQQNDFTHFFLQLFLASHWGFEKGASFNGPIWSISVEIRIYLLFFLTARFIGKSAFINVFVLCLCVAANLAKAQSLTIDCLIFFYAGGLSAILLQRLENSSYYKTMNIFLFCLVFIATIVIIDLKLYQSEYFMYIFLASYTPALLYFISQIKKPHPKAQMFVEMAGNMTYASYLIHFPIQITIALFCNLTHQAIPFYNTSFFIAFISATLISSVLIYRCFEMPAQRYFRKKFT